uniref:Uncharacterized protein n=1 Tax=Leersia perrieri TaxID=77586 RepID=A0A0D9Y041_9ORYZ
MEYTHHIYRDAFRDCSKPVLFQCLVVTTIIFPLFIVYTFGVYISTAISLSRLARHNFNGNSADASGANLGPALHVLYLLALVQGVLHTYGVAFILTRHKVVSRVTEEYAVIKSVHRYAAQIWAKCWQDPSSVRGRNLATHAVELMESASVYDYAFHDGVRIVDALIQRSIYSQHQQQHAVIRQILIRSTSSSHILGKLMEAMSWYDDDGSKDGKDMGERAARIVDHFATDIRLNNLPEGIEYISSMIQLSADTRSKDMLLQGLKILRSLAAHNDNCRVMSDTEGLVSRIMAIVSSDLLHSVHHDAWSSVALASMKLVRRLVTAPGVTGANLRREISSNGQAMTSMESILECNECQPPLRKLAIKILTQLAMDASSSMSVEKLAKSLVRIFTDGRIRKSALEALAMLCAKSKGNAVVILQADRNVVVGVLKELLLHSEEIESRISAAEILTHLRINYTEDDEYLVELKKAINDVIPEVLREVLRSGVTGKEIQKGPEADKDRFSPPGTVDIEGQDSNSINTNSSSRPRNDGQHGDVKLMAAFLYLIATIFEISKAKDLVQLADAVAPGDAAFTFAGKLKEMIERSASLDGYHKNNAHQLRIMKLITKMVISMVRNRGSSYTKEDEDLDRLMEYLCDASRAMYDIDGVMSIAGNDHGAKPPFKTLASLVKEARELWDKKKAQASSVNVNLNT